MHSHVQLHLQDDICQVICKRIQIGVLVMAANLVQNGLVRTPERLFDAIPRSVLNKIPHSLSAGRPCQLAQRHAFGNLGDVP
jgi:hypothetical protein